MASRADVDRLVILNRGVAALVVRDLLALWATLDLSNPDGARDRLLELVPVLVRRYGDIAATVAADWYVSVRSAAGVRGAFKPLLADPPPAAQIEGTVRRAAGYIYAQDPSQALSSLASNVAKYAVGTGRRTIGESSRVDPAKPRVARVPMGPSTCDFCLMLASRGPVYWSKESAGQYSKFHDHDDCQVVVVFGGDLPEGYDPDELYDEYQASRKSSSTRRRETSPVDAAEIARGRELYQQSYEAYRRGDLDEWRRLQAEAKAVQAAAYNAAGVGLG